MTAAAEFVAFVVVGTFLYVACVWMARTKAAPMLARLVQFHLPASIQLTKGEAIEGST